MIDSLDKIIERIYSTSRDAIGNKNFDVYEENIDLLIDLFKQSINQSSDVKKSDTIRKLEKSIFDTINLLIKNNEIKEAKNYLEKILFFSNELDYIEIVIDDILSKIGDIIEQGDLKLSQNTLKIVFEINHGRKFLDNTGINLILEKYIEQIETAKTFKEINDMEIDDLLELVINNLEPIESQFLNRTMYNHDLVRLYTLYMRRILENEYVDSSYILKIVRRIIIIIDSQNTSFKKKELTKVLCYIIKDNIYVIKNSRKTERDNNFKRINLVNEIIKEITNSDRYLSVEYTQNVVVLSIFIYLYYLANEEESVLAEDRLKYARSIGEIRTYDKRTLASYINIRINDIWRFYKDVFDIINQWDYSGNSQSKWIILPSITFELFLIISAIKRELEIDKVNSSFYNPISEDDIFKFLNAYYTDGFDIRLSKKFEKIYKMMTNKDTYKSEIEILEAETIKFYKKQLFKRQNIDDSEIEAISRELSQQIITNLNKEIVFNSKVKVDNKKIPLETIIQSTEYFRCQNIQLDRLRNYYLNNIYSILVDELSKNSETEDINKKDYVNIYDEVRNKLKAFEDLNLYIGEDLNNVNKFLFSPQSLLDYHKYLKKVIYVENLYDTLLYLNIDKMFLAINSIEIYTQKLTDKEIKEELKNFEKDNKYKILVVNNIELPFEFEEAYQYIQNEKLKIEGIININVNHPIENGIRFNIKYE